MPYPLKILRKLAFGAICAAVAGFPAGAATYDLKSDWSNANNPNGPWTYLAGSTVLPSLNGADWAGAGLGPAFAQSSSFGYGFTPAIFQYNGSAPSVVTASAGDIVAHTQGLYSNQGAGDFSVDFTSPTAGTANISGEVWYAHGSGIDRWQYYTLSVDGVVMASGTLEGPANGPGNPDLFNLSSLTLFAGEIVQLKVVMTSGGTDTNGALVGLDMGVRLTPAVPELSTWAMMLLGFAGLGYAGARSSRKISALV